MRRFLIALTALWVVLTFCGFSFSGEGHEEALSSHDFRVANAKVRFELKPEYFRKGETQQVVITLSDFMTGSPVIDAEIYLLIEKSGRAPVHAGHARPSASKPSIRDDAGLDFGDAAQEAVSFDLSMFKKLQPQQKAGVYAVDYPMTQTGDYGFTIAFKSIAGKRFLEPLIYGGSFSNKEESRASLYRTIFVIAIILLSGVAGVWIIDHRRKLKLGTGQKLNILDIPPIKRFASSGWFQPVFQIPAFIFFVIVIAAGLFDIQKGDMNIATLLMWTIWWAGIIFTFVFAGRIWCMTCPVGAVQDWAGRLISMNRDFPRPLRNIYLSSAMFFGLTWWDGFSGIVNKPALTAYLLIGFFVAAIGMALIFKGRAFCRYVCPIGGLIGIYSMFSPVELRNKCLDVCREHEVKECIKGAGKGKPCPMFVTPMTLDRNNYCNFCSECIKSCSRDNIVVRFRSFAKDLWVSSRGYLDEALLAMVLVGVTIVVTGEMVEPWHKWMDAIGKLMPFESVGIRSHAAREKATFLFVLTSGSLIVAPALLLLTSLIVRKASPDSPLTTKQTFVQFAYMFIPVGISMHLAHNISHLFKEGPGIVPAFRRAIGNFVGGSEPDWTVMPLAGAESIFWLQMIVLVTLNIFSLYAGYRIAVRYYKDGAMRAFVPMALLVIFFMALNTYVLGQPMALRHTH